MKPIYSTSYGGLEEEVVVVVVVKLMLVCKQLGNFHNIREALEFIPNSMVD